MGEATEQVPAWVNLDAIVSPEQRQQLDSVTTRVRALLHEHDALFGEAMHLVEAVGRTIPDEVECDTFAQWVPEYRRCMDALYTLHNAGALAHGDGMCAAGVETYPRFFVEDLLKQGKPSGWKAAAWDELVEHAKSDPMLDALTRTLDDGGAS